MPNIADAAVAPLLRGQPGDHREQVGAAPRRGTRRWRRPTTTRCRAGRAGTRRTRGGRAGPRSSRRTTRSGRPCGRAAPRAGTAAARPRGRGGRAWRRASTPSPTGSAPRVRTGRHADLQQREHLGRVQRLAGVAVAPDGGRRGEHRVEHRLLGGLDGRGEQRVERAAGDQVGPVGRPSRSSRIPVPNAEEDLAAAVVGDRAGPRQPEPDPAGQPRAGGAVDRRVGDDHPDARAGGCRSGATAAGPSSRPTGTPATTHSSRTPKFVSSSTATVWPSGGDPGGGADAALEVEARHPGAGPDRALRRRRGRRRVRPSAAACGGAHVVGGHLHPAAVVEEGVVALARRPGSPRRRRPRGAARARSRRRRRRPARAASSRSGRPASRSRPTRRR